MSKAEEYSFNIPSELFQQLTKEQQVLWRKEIENTFNNGYQQAEKDLELTWEDMETIQEIANKYCKYNSCEPRFFVYSEVLKRFKDFKEMDKK